MTNKIAVAIPSFKRPIDLGALILSIDSAVPIYVSDNGNFLSDEFKREHSRVTISCPSLEVVPQFVNWNNAAKLPSEDWVLMPGDDDIYYPDSFKIIRRYINQFGDSDMLIFGHKQVDADYHVFGEWMPNRLLTCDAPSGFEIFKYGVPARMPSIIFKKSLLRRLNYFDESIELVADSDLIFRALLMGKTTFAPEVISGYRVWLGGATSYLSATSRWLNGVLCMVRKLEMMLGEHPVYSQRARMICAEIYAANLLSAARQLNGNRGVLDVVKLLREYPYPKRAKLRTQLKLVRQLVRFW